MQSVACKDIRINKGMNMGVRNFAVFAFPFLHIILVLTVHIHEEVCSSHGLGFGVWGLGFRVQGVRALGLRA